MPQRLFKRPDSPNWYVYLGKDKNGNDIVRSTRCRDRRAAEHRGAEIERRFHAPRDPTPSPTLAATLTRAVNEREERGRAEDTIGFYKVKAGVLLRVLGRDTRIADIDAKVIDDYTSTRTKEVGRNTVSKELTVLSVALRLARRRGEYPHDVDAVMPVGWSAEYNPKERALTPDEMRRVLADLLDDDLPMTRKPPGPPRKIGSKRSDSGPAPTESKFERTRQRSMKNRAARVAFIVATSARWSESERASRDDIGVHGGVDAVLLHGKKTETAKRIVPILPTTEPLLALALKYGNKKGRLFEKWTNVRRDLHAVCRRLGIKPVSPNDLRRTTSQWLRSAGVETHLIYPVLGHKDARMVERVYGRITPKALGDALRDRLSKVKPLTVPDKADRGPRRKNSRS